MQKPKVLLDLVYESIKIDPLFYTSLHGCIHFRTTVTLEITRNESNLCMSQRDLAACQRIYMYSSKSTGLRRDDDPHELTLAQEAARDR